MAKLTPQEFREKHARRLKGAITDIEAGVDRVTEAPGKKAAAKQEKMKQRLMESLNNGTWAKRVGAVSLEDWKSKMKNKGIGRISAGIDEAAPKVENFATQFLPFLDTVKAKVDKMPDVTLDDSINRMTTQIRETAKFKMQ